MSDSLDKILTQLKQDVAKVIRENKTPDLPTPEVEDKPELPKYMVMQAVIQLNIADVSTEDALKIVERCKERLTLLQAELETMTRDARGY